MEEKKMMDDVREINRHIKDGIEQWARICLRADAGSWAYLLDYDEMDVIHVCLLFQHVCTNIGIKGGKIGADEAELLGNRLHDLTFDMTGIDTRKVLDGEEDC